MIAEESTFMLWLKSKLMDMPENTKIQCLEVKTSSRNEEIVIQRKDTEKPYEVTSRGELDKGYIEISYRFMLVKEGVNYYSKLNQVRCRPGATILKSTYDADISLHPDCSIKLVVLKNMSMTAENGQVIYVSEFGNLFVEKEQGQCMTEETAFKASAPASK